MPNEPLFPDKYPRGTSKGVVAVLCEGDINSYEAALLESWADQNLKDEPIVDVWPCGTADAVRGMADAIGRSVFIAAVLDRDFHGAQSEAELQGEWVQDAGKLGWSFLGIRLWSRNEIENYFLDDDVLLPVCTKFFACGDELVIKAVDRALQVLLPSQAMEYALHHLRLAWKKTDPRAPVQKRKANLPSVKPKWTATGLTSVDPDEIATELPERFEVLRSAMITDGPDGVFREPWSGKQFCDRYRQFVARWRASTHSTPDWRTEWAGKEVLKLVRQQLAADRPVRLEPNSQPQTVSWHSLGKNREERDRLSGEKDRLLENLMRPLFVQQLMSVMASSPVHPTSEEFNAIGEMLRAAQK